MWSIIFGILSLILTWWMNRRKSGSPPPAREIRRTNHLIAMVDLIKLEAVPMGCSPTGHLDADAVSETLAHPVMQAVAAEPMEAMEMEGWFDEKVIGLFISNVAVPKLMAKTAEQWEASLMGMYREFQK